jgi:hypothetical protein
MLHRKEGRNLKSGSSGLWAISQGKSPIHMSFNITGAHLEGRFFAEAWKGPQKVTSTVFNNLRQEFETDLNRLSRKLPYRFFKTLNQVRERLPRIFTLPFVISHSDLNETNILVDGAGYIAAVIDWAGHYHDNAKELRDEFWRVFKINVGGIQEEVKENIRLARMAGLFLRYGFEQDGSARGRVRDTDFALRYAEAFCTEGI